MPDHKYRETRQKHKISLTTLLTGLVSLVVLLTSTILLIASYESKKQSLLETTLHLNSFNARKLSQTMDSLFISMRSSLEFSARTFAGIEQMDTDVVSRELELMRNSSNYFNSVILVDKGGLVLQSAPESLNMSGKYIVSPITLHALKLQKPYVSGPYTTSSTGRMIVFMSQPVFNTEGMYVGLIGGSFYLQQDNVLSMAFGANAIDDSGSYYYIVDSKGHLLFHPDKKRIGDDISGNSIVQKLMRGESGQAQAFNLQSVNMLAGYAHVPSNGWGVVVVSPSSVIYDQLYQYLRMTFMYTLIPFVLLLFGVIYVSHRLAKPFVFLADLVSKLSTEKVELPERKSHWNREAELLTQAIFLAYNNLQKQTESLTQEAMTDPLTGLDNRRMLEQKLQEWIAAELSFSLIVVDVDKFKFINDTYGHLTGDEVLKHVAAIISASVRPSDICCRYGGEEFVLMLLNTSTPEALTVAERIRVGLEESRIPTGSRITVSQGIAHYPSQAGSGAELLQRADEALYEAKNRGRNRTVVSGE